jgi:membrane protein
MKQLSSAMKDLGAFLSEGIWMLRIRDLSGSRRQLVLALRVLLMSIRKFISDECALWSSALTFYSLMSLVPVAAVIFAVAKGFGFKKLLQERLMEQFAGQEEMVVYIIDFSNRMLDSTRGGLLAGAGVIVLLWAVISMLGNIEQSFNNIWGVTRERSLGRKFSDYLSVMLVAPVLLITSISAAVMVVTHLGTVTSVFGLTGYVAPLTNLLLRLVPFLLTWLLLSFMYIFIPNRKIGYTSGILAGAIAGIIVIMVQKAYLAFQIGVSLYNAIYGSFAALPLFLIFLQLSWIIVLFGAEISYAHQNVHTCGRNLAVTPYLKKIIGLTISQRIVQNYVGGEPGPTAQDLSETLELPPAFIQGLLGELRASGIILEANPGGDEDPTYVPARDTNTLTVAMVVEALGRRETACAPLHDPDLEEILREFERSMEASPANRLLKDLPARKAS